MRPLNKLPGPGNPAALATALETLSSLGVIRAAGLSTSDAKARLTQFGTNEIPEKRDQPLVSAVPVALPVMFAVSMAVGSMELAGRGVLITRLSAAEDAANMDVLCADKTGTLTANRLSITGALPQPGFTEDDVLRYGALASNEANQDPIDMAFLRVAQERQLLNGTEKTLSFVRFSPQTRRTEVLVQIGGGTVRVMKGAIAGDALPVARMVAQELNLGEIVRAPQLKAVHKDSAERAAALAHRSSGFAEVFPGG